MKATRRTNKERFLHSFVRLVILGISFLVFMSVTPSNQMPYLWVFVVYALTYVVLAGATLGYTFSSTVFLLMWLGELARYRKGK